MSVKNLNKYLRENTTEKRDNKLTPIELILGKKELTFK